MRTIFFFILFIQFSICVNAQDEYETKKKDEKKEETKSESSSKSYTGMSDFKRNLRIGGGFNIGSSSIQGIQSQIFFTQISPQATYVMNEVFEGGLSTSYSYFGTFDNLNVHSLSAGPILRANILDQFFLQVEGLGFYNKVAENPYGFSTKGTYNINAFIGGGFMSRFSETSYMLTGLKVNLMKNELTNNQIIPIGFTSIHFGLW